jgi:hypothetical protein
MATSVALLWFVGACSTGGDQPRVEAWDGSAFEPVAHTAYRVSGTRDGSVTRALAEFDLSDGSHLEVQLDIDYNPTPSLGKGEWRLDGNSPASGVVHSESLKFLGGQGQYATVGGRFRLEEDGVPRFRVVLPARPVEPDAWEQR